MSYYELSQDVEQNTLLDIENDEGGDLIDDIIEELDEEIQEHTSYNISGYYKRILKEVFKVLIIAILVNFMTKIMKSGRVGFDKELIELLVIQAVSFSCLFPYYRRS